MAYILAKPRRLRGASDHYVAPAAGRYSELDAIPRAGANAAWIIDGFWLRRRRTVPIVLHADGTLKAGGHETLAADVRWLACREVCVPGHQTLNVNLPIATSAMRVAPNAVLFSQALERIPQPLPAKSRASIVSAKDHFLIKLQLGHPASGAVFFPLDANQIDNAAAQQVQPLPDGVQVVVKKDENLRGQPARIRGVVELGGGRAYDIAAPVVSAVNGELTDSPP